MNDAQRRRLERLERAHSFGTAHAADFPPTSKGGQALARLGTLIQGVVALDARRTTHHTESRQATSSKRDRREGLRRQLAAISETARVIGLDDPELKDAFPRPRANLSDQAMLSVARSFAAAAEAHRARFVEYEMPADFIERLNASIEGFDEAAVRQTAGAGARVSASAGLEEALDRAEEELARLDAAVHNKFQADVAALTAWESARRLERAPRSRAGEDSTPVGTVAPASTK
jgi:hypothetical protein